MHITTSGSPAAVRTRCQAVGSLNLQIKQISKNRKTRSGAQEGVLPGMVEARYSSYTHGIGKQIRAGKVCPC